MNKAKRITAEPREPDGLTNARELDAALPHPAVARR